MAFSLCFWYFWRLYLACLQSVQRQYRRQQAEQAVEAGMFSLFSEYEPHAFWSGMICSAWIFLLQEAFKEMTGCAAACGRHMAGQLADAAGKFPEGLEPQGIFIQDPERLTDDGGAVFVPAGGQDYERKKRRLAGTGLDPAAGVSGTGGKKSGTFSGGLREI